MTLTAFQGDRRIARGERREVMAAAWRGLEQQPDVPVLIFDDETGREVDMDLRETALAPEPPPKAGRPKLGVVAREVTLMPRHWEWLGRQPGGASVTLRKLVETARRDPEQMRRAARDACYQIMRVVAGNRGGFEDAVRALYADDRATFTAMIVDWPQDLRADLLERLGWDGQ